VPYLRHPAERYEATAEGSLLVELVFSTPEGSTRSRGLASCFGVDPWDFGRHALDASRADLAALRALFNPDARSAAHGEGVTTPPGPCCDDVARFLALRDAGYQFFFLPNG
jgi:hypothetical protein